MMFYYVIQKTEIRYEFSQIILPQSFSTSLSSKYFVVFICHRNEKHQQITYRIDVKLARDIEK